MWHHPGSAIGTAGHRQRLSKRTRRQLETEFAIEQEHELERQRAEAVYLVQKARHEQQEREILEHNQIEQERYREESIRWENDRTRVEVERKRLENEQLRQEVT
ncbi:uncharacterized protein MELLADRAFT_85006 [Melampsora larici-populina 98AG31]|uniref:Uncharacterized protein n=1 Tax=Melampsora larici-populina (strain 98AG31 / pathotype 3-4-7) TaxID=747676 RepID=F4RGZ8_MELLP|nr:uncharacterized protein MELLADRAFT_85006 [Melampsora larici-populina 98AG31]EGG08322.1 hypothetical protein MELLADRAFT_85006 [Melampsora larici-populina 98AG31]